MEDAKTRKSIRRLFCLPFLPTEQIQPVFATILVCSSQRFSPVTPLTAPTACLTTLRTHGYTAPSALRRAGLYLTAASDCEGWHRRWTQTATDTICHILPTIVNLLHQEASFVDVQAQLISEEKFKRVLMQCLKYKFKISKERSSRCGKIILQKHWMERSYSVRSARSTNHAHGMKLLNCILLYILLLLSIYVFVIW